jgi:cell division protein FtsL
MAQRTDIRYVQYYTGGSAARKLAPVAPLQTMRLPKAKKQKRITVCIDPVAVASICMALVMAVLIVVGLVQLNSARQEVQTMSQHVQTLQSENAQLQQTFTEGYDIQQIERTAHALGLVPVEQVQHVTVRLPQLEEPVEPTPWERFTTFLVGLFA